MLIAAIVFSAIFALIFAIILGYGFSRKGPGPAGGIIFIFLIILMFTWALGSWIEPIGPRNWGVPWLSYLLIAFFITLLIGALIPSSRARSPVITKEEIDEEIRSEDKTSQVLGITFGVFFWLLIITLLIIGLVKVFG